MTKFEKYLVNHGLLLAVAHTYNNVIEKFIAWVIANQLNVETLKRSEFSNWIEYCRRIGNKEVTIKSKEAIIAKYYQCMGYANNPAKNWIKHKQVKTLPPKALTFAEMQQIYLEQKPKSAKEVRERACLGLIMFQGLLLKELSELRVNDFDFEAGTVYIQGQHKTNTRTLKLEPMQILHLYDYLNKYRAGFLAIQSVKTDKFFMTFGGTGEFKNAGFVMLKRLKLSYPQIIDTKHLRGSIIEHWIETVGIVQAMYNSGIRYISSVERYQKNKYLELQDQLALIHPLDRMIA